MANSLLAKAFRQDAYISPTGLQHLVFEACCVFQARTGTPLLTQPFRVGPDGPFLDALAWKFQPFEGCAIIEYAHPAGGAAMVADESKPAGLGRSLEIVWAEYLRLGENGLAGRVCRKGGAWDRARKAGQETLEPDVLAGEGWFFLGRPLPR